MPTLVSDSSCLIDLHKVDLLIPLLDLPYAVVVPQTLFDDELIRLTDEEKRALAERGLQARNLDASRLIQAQHYFNDFPALAWNDCLALCMAEETNGAILLTGDAHLRQVATDKAIEVHGVIWVLDQLHQLAIVRPVRLAQAVRLWLEDPLVFLPQGELRQRLRRLGA